MSDIKAPRFFPAQVSNHIFNWATGFVDNLQQLRRRRSAREDMGAVTRQQVWAFRVAGLPNRASAARSVGVVRRTAAAAGQAVRQGFPLADEALSRGKGK
jgi:hypothetical protein